MVSDDIKHEVKNLHIGKKIRVLRKNAGLVLQDLSDRTGLSKPLLSQIEKEVVSPPIATLLKISKALSVNIGFFFQDNDPEEKVVLVRRDESKVIDSRYFGRDIGVPDRERAIRSESGRFPLFRILYSPCVQSIGKEERKSINGGLSNTIKNKGFGLG